MQIRFFIYGEIKLIVAHSATRVKQSLACISGDLVRTLSFLAMTLLC